MICDACPTSSEHIPSSLTLRPVLYKGGPLDSVYGSRPKVRPGHVVEVVMEGTVSVLHLEGVDALAVVALYVEGVLIREGVPQATVVVLPDHLHAQGGHVTIT